MQLDAFALSVPGRRSNNEDAVCARPELGLFVVADGLGGYDGGEVASALAIETISELVRRTACDADVTWPYKLDPARSLVENEVIVATRLADERIHARRHGALEQMGSTVAVLKIERGHAVIAHVGDSRVYRLRGGALAQLTIDHSLVSEMIAAGMQPDASFPWRHVITRALGMAKAEPDVQLAAIQPGDVFLLCSDGLYEGLADNAIAALLELPAEEACHALVRAAYEGGSRDNISAVVVRCG
ncbi:MAG TPA: protein phosphatase 2C domain-containing protein [Kofleriaceae bacterium]|nr:protein phosphatase 2C domain-containing protein [Kofleriaceae bacterium]